MITRTCRLWSDPLGGNWRITKNGFVGRDRNPRRCGFWKSTSGWLASRATTQRKYGAWRRRSNSFALPSSLPARRQSLRPGQNRCPRRRSLGPRPVPGRSSLERQPRLECPGACLTTACCDRGPVAVRWRRFQADRTAGRDRHPGPPGGAVVAGVGPIPRVRPVRPSAHRGCLGAFLHEADGAGACLGNHLDRPRSTTSDRPLTA